MIRNSTKIFFVAIALVFVAGSTANAAVIGRPANNLGLVGYWPFNEGAGTKVEDLSGNRNTGDFNNTPQWTTGISGRALSFDTSNYVRIPNTAALNPTNAITVSVWIYALDWGDNHRILQKGETDNQIRLLKEGADFRFDLFGVSGSAFVSSQDPSINQWHHIVGTYDGATIALYMDGALLDSSPETGSIAVTSDDLLIGTKATGAPPGDHFNGKIDEVRIYNRGLTASEVRDLYTKSRNGIAYTGSSGSLNGGSALTNGLVGHWTFDNLDVTDKVYDKSGQQHNGYFIGGATSGAKVAGKLGQALKIGALNNYVRVASTSALVLSSGPFSISGWIYATSTATQMIAFHGLGCSTFASWWLSIGGNENQSDFQKYAFGFNTSNAGGTTKRVATSGNASTSQWTLLTGTYDGSSMLSLYVNGVLQATSSVSGNPYASYEHLYLGIDPGCGGRFPANIIDDVRVYNKLLSATEVKQLYNLGGQKLNSPATTLQNGSSLARGLIGYWSFDNLDVTDKVYDKSGQGKHGYIYNMATTTMKTAGKLGQALSFDGQLGRIIFPLTNLSTVNSTSVWVNTQDPDAVIVGDGLGDYGLYIDGTDVYYSANASNYVQVPHGTISPGEWTHYVTVRNGLTVTFYKNGAQLGTPQTLPGSDDELTLQAIGAYYDATHPSQAKIDDLRLYNRLLTPSEVKQLYNLGR